MRDHTTAHTHTRSTHFWGQHFTLPTTHTHTHTHTHSHTQTHTHTYTQRAFLGATLHPSTNTLLHTAHTHTHTHIHTCTHTGTLLHTAHTCRGNISLFQPHTHTHTCTLYIILGATLHPSMYLKRKPRNTFCVHAQTYLHTHTHTRVKTCIHKYAMANASMYTCLVVLDTSKRTYTPLASQCVC